VISVFAHDDPAFWRRLRRRPARSSEQAQAVAAIIADVEARGAEAVLESARRFDAPGLETLFASEAEIDSAAVEPDLLDALRLAIERVRDYHEVQMELITEGWEALEAGWGWRMAAWEDEEEEEHGMLGQRMLPLRRIGVYAPGGQASYPSSVIMNAVPALAAGVREIVLATPARADGSLDPAILAVCRELGIRQVVKAGGAAAIAALALGIDGLEEVEKIAGPGSSWVAEAKRQLWGVVGLDMYAGPSEVAVWCLQGAHPEFAAADLSTQVEHAEDNAALLVCSSEVQLGAVLQKVEEQAIAADRGGVIRSALAQNGLACWAEPERAAEIINRFAPEHLAILGEGAEAEVARIENAGAIALGDWTPQSAGDYLSGPSHTLPTSGAARFSSPVSCLDFLKVQSLSSMDRAEIAALGPAIERLARHEGFPAHAAGSSLRREQLQ
jgi:histidinol dehydrogenase